MTQHVLFISPYIYPSLVKGSGVEHAGGAELQQAQIARLLAKNGFRVSVLTLDFGQPDRTVADGIEIHKLPATNKRGIKGLRWITPRLTDIAAALFRLAPDTVYVRTTTAYTAPAAWYARRAGKRFVFAGALDADFGVVRTFPVTRRDWFLHRWGLRRADVLLAQNLKQQGDAKRFQQREAQIFPNFLCASDEGRADADGPVLWVGTMRPPKRPELFVELARQCPDRKFVMVGGPQADAGAQAIMDRVQALAKDVPNLELRGYVPPQLVGRVFDGASLLVNTSIIEGFPNTFLQSWIRGVPTVSFVDPVIHAGESGTVVCADMSELKQQVLRLATDRHAWTERSRHVREYFERYHGETAAAERYMALFGAGVPP